MWNLLHGKTAEGLSLSAQYCLGFCYYKVEGVQRDLPQARYWQNRAATQGHDKAKELSLTLSILSMNFDDITQMVHNFPKTVFPIEI